MEFIEPPHLGQRIRSGTVKMRQAPEPVHLKNNILAFLIGCGKDV